MEVKEGGGGGGRVACRMFPQMAGNATEILKMSRFCERLVFLNDTFVKKIKGMDQVAQKCGGSSLPVGSTKNKNQGNPSLP